MGYYITKKAWDDPAKQKACVQFVESMTTDQVVSKFGATAVTALKNGTTVPEGADSLTLAATKMVNGQTGISAAAQDNLGQQARTALFADIKNIVSGKQDPAKSVETALTTKG